MKLSKQVYDYVSDTSNYDMDDILERITSEIPRLKLKNTQQISLDECSIYWGDTEDDYLLCLDDYTREVFKKTCEMVVNVIESFEERAE